MQQSFSELTYIVGSPEQVEAMAGVPALTPFSACAVDFLNCVSGKLLKCGKAFSDVVTFAFWCRKAALLQEKAKYGEHELRLGLGIAFHSTPSNVPVNFAFSFAAGLLAGNANIIRLPGRDFEQVGLICRAIDEALHELPDMAPYVALVKYPSNREISDYFSSLCDARIVWGGDATIARMRQSPLPPRAREITFADRHSLLVLDAEAVLAAENIDRLAQNFYNDTYFTDQNACTSPCVIVWLGKNRQKAKKYFWDAVTRLKNKYMLAPVQAVGKLAAFYRIAAQKNVQLIPTGCNFITRINVHNLEKDLLNFKYNSGFFLEYDANELMDIAPVCTKKCQTLIYFGISHEKFIELIKKVSSKGIDRIVPLGQSMSFNLIWDGYDLIHELSRVIFLK